MKAPAATVDRLARRSVVEGRDDRAPVHAAPVSRRDVVGGDVEVPLIDGRRAPYVNLDNAASTPALRRVADVVSEFLPWYSGVHRGTGFKSRVATAAFDQARCVVGEFVGADPERDVVVFTKNATEAINKLARALELGRDAVVLTTGIEHHSNDLPWRQVAHTEAIAVSPQGALDLDHLDALLHRHAGRALILAVSGASNVTGIMPPIHDVAAKVHAVGGRIVVDAAQLAPHRSIDMRRHDDPGHLDHVVMSGHKFYAPFGGGALVGARSSFGPRPHDCGGGTVNAVTADAVAWAELPDREEAGSPNVVGAVAMAAASLELRRIGFDRIASHERRLTSYAVDRLRSVPGVRVAGPDPADTERVGVVSFTVDGMDHGLVAAVLGYEHGVGVRNGCFCAHPYVATLLDLEDDDWFARAGDGDKRGIPGLVRMSFGCYNDAADVDVAVGAIAQLAAGETAAAYELDRDGSFHPVGYAESRPFALT